MLIDPQSMATVLASGSSTVANTWQTINLHYTPPSSRQLLIRVTAANSGGSYDWGYSIPVASGGGNVFVIEDG
jgi:hypothetical protein